MALAAVSRAADQAAHLRLLAEARGAAAWVEASLTDQAVARADAERAILAAAKLERTVIYAVARAEFDSAGAGSLGEAAYEAAIRAAAVLRSPVLLRSAGTPVSTRVLASRARHAAPTAGASPLAVAAHAMAGASAGELRHPTGFCGAVVDMGDSGFGAATVYTIARAGYSTECPNVGALLKNLKFDLAMEGAMMDPVLKNGADPKETAKAWLKANPDVVKPWLQGVTTLDGGDAAAAVDAALNG